MEKGKVISRKIIFAAIALIAVVFIILILIFSSIFLADSSDNMSANNETEIDGDVSSVYNAPRESEIFAENTDSTVTERTSDESEIITESSASVTDNNYQVSESFINNTESTAADSEYPADEEIFRLVTDLTEDTENLNRIFASIIEQNAAKLENIVEYGDKFCTNYVSVKNDLKVHEAILEELRVLSNAICDGENDDYEKVRKIAYWVAENVYYNEVAASTSVNEETISLETVLETKTATCAGYSNLFSALCNMQDIYCINMRGGTSAAVTTDIFLLSAPVNHEWNAVKLDGEWVFVDTAWLSNNKYTENGYQKSGGFDDIYFGMGIELMSYEHRIDLVDYRDFKSSVNAFDENGRWAE